MLILNHHIMPKNATYFAAERANVLRECVLNFAGKETCYRVAFWNDSILSRIHLLAMQIQGKGFIAGSAARWALGLVEDPPSDIDIFATSADDDNYKKLAKAIEVYCNYVAPEVRPRFLGQYNYEFKHKLSKYPHFNVQLIERYETDKVKTFGTPEEVVKRFDFNASQFWLSVDADRNLYVHHMMTPLDLLERNLRLTHCSNPITTLYRYGKYVKKGWYGNWLLMIQLLDSWTDVDEEIRERLLEMESGMDIRRLEMFDLTGADLIGTPLIEFMPFPADEEERIPF